MAMKMPPDMRKPIIKGIAGMTQTESLMLAGVGLLIIALTGPLFHLVIPWGLCATGLNLLGGVVSVTLIRLLVSPYKGRERYKQLYWQVDGHVALYRQGGQEAPWIALLARVWPVPTPRKALASEEEGSSVPGPDPIAYRLTMTGVPRATTALSPDQGGD